MASAPPAAEPFVSVVVTTKDAAVHLPHLLGDFDGLDWPRDRLEIVLVDAHSTDGTWQIIQDFAARSSFPVIAQPRAGFIGAGRNRGFELARGVFVAVTDADMRVPPDWLRRLIAGMDEGVGVVGGPNETHARDLTSRTIAAIPTHGPSVGAVPLIGRNRWQTDYETDADVYGAVTRNSLFRKEAFDAAGGFDESLRVTEDPELNYRILRAGFRIRYRRAAAVEHVHRDSLAAYFRQQRLYAYWQAHVSRKHPGLAAAKQKAPAIAALVFLLTVPLFVVDPRLALVPAALVASGVAIALLYGVRVAAVKRDPLLALSIPIFFLAWQLAWVFGYPAGAWRARRG